MSTRCGLQIFLQTQLYASAGTSLTPRHASGDLMLDGKTSNTLIASPGISLTLIAFIAFCLAFVFTELDYDVKFIIICDVFPAMSMSTHDSQAARLHVDLLSRDVRPSRRPWWLAAFSDGRRAGHDGIFPRGSWCPLTFRRSRSSVLQAVWGLHPHLNLSQHQLAPRVTVRFTPHSTLVDRGFNPLRWGSSSSIPCPFSALRSPNVILFLIIAAAIPLLIAKMIAAQPLAGSWWAMLNERSLA
jgi:hypothetical protein